MPEITITAKRDGFRRCGVEHRDTPVVWPDGSFTEEQITILRNEPQLVVHQGGAVSDDVQSELLRSRTRIIELEHTIDQLRVGQSELEKAQVRIAGLEAANADLQQKLDAVIQSGNELAEERDRLKAELLAASTAAAPGAEDGESSSKASRK
ncbi:TPA: hypothetical protein NJV01_003377 [Escherichia coli]|nr:hypothetical protein [Escherichia coli]HCG2937300.1 hypothetical protein [Escherichia coli]HCG3100408.1 hypothetical protein [Escherichia coli]